MKTAIFIGATVLFAGCRPQSGVPTEPMFSDIPAWADEFDYEGLPDKEKWGYDVGSLHDGWGNQELQYYTENRLENAAVSDGVLRITARNESYEGMDYTSARLVSRGKGDFLYGRFEARAKLPAGLGTWPAIWMLPTSHAYGNWPASGEIDIMEHVGFDHGTVHISVHTDAYNHLIGTQQTATHPIADVNTTFHVYRLDWTPDYMQGFIDGELLFEFANDGTGSAAWPFDQPFHWLLNVAVGGSWGGQKGVDDDTFPANMEIDYVRVYPLAESQSH